MISESVPKLFAKFVYNFLQFSCEYSGIPISEFWKRNERKVVFTWFWLKEFSWKTFQNVFSGWRWGKVAWYAINLKRARHLFSRVQNSSRRAIFGLDKHNLESMIGRFAIKLFLKSQNFCISFFLLLFFFFFFDFLEVAFILSEKSACVPSQEKI